MARLGHGWVLLAWESLVTSYWRRYLLERDT